MPQIFNILSINQTNNKKKLSRVLFFTSELKTICTKIGTPILFFQVFTCKEKLNILSFKRKNYNNYYNNDNDELFTFTMSKIYEL